MSLDRQWILDGTPIAWMTNRITDKVDFIKIKNLCVSNGTPPPPYRTGGNICKSHVCKGPISRIYKELFGFNNKKKPNHPN